MASIRGGASAGQHNTPLRVRVRIQLGDGKERPSEETTWEVSKLLKELKDGFELQ